MYSTQAPHVPRQNLTISAQLSIVVYGEKQAKTDEQRRAQGFIVLREGQPTARADLSGEDRQAVATFLAENYPEHARI